MPDVDAHRRGAAAAVEQRVLGAAGRALGRFGMLQPGDRVAVGVSGGKTASACCTPWSPTGDARRSSTTWSR